MSAKLIIDVHAGIIPGEPIEQYGRRWSLTADEANDPDELTRALGHSLEYAAMIRRPDLVNWVRHEWVWL